MLRAQKKEGQPNDLTKLSGVIAGKKIKDPDHNSNTHKKKVANGIDRREMIATAAYYRAEIRGFSCGHEIEDWLEAEKYINSRS